MAGGTLTSGSWTVAPAYATGSGLSGTTSIQGKQREVRLKLSLASGAIARGGLKLPGFQSVGLHRNLNGYIMHHVCSSTTGRLVTGVVTTNVKNKFYTMNVTGNKIVAMSSTMVTGTSTESFQPLATSVESAVQVFFMTAYGW